MNNPIPLPAPTQERLRQMIEEQRRIAALVDATIQAVREALDVPPDYVIRDVTRGFEPPAEAQE